jgi:hypothetical protein
MWRRRVHSQGLEILILIRIIREKNDLDPLFYISLLDSELRSVGNDNRSLIRYLLIWSYHISHGDNKTQVLIYLRSKFNFLKQININRFVL